MKTLAIICAMTFIVTVLYANDDNAYKKAMKEAFENMEHAQTIDDFREVANRFERIAEVDKDKWQPLYHAAYARVIMAAMEQDPGKKDPHLDQARGYLDKMEEMEYDTVEKLVLEGFLLMIRMSVDPSRGMELGPDCGMILSQAYAMDSLNPRAVLMMAQFNFGSSSYMGMDTSGPCAMFDDSIELFDQENPDETDPFLPCWGKEMATMMKAQCE